MMNFEQLKFNVDAYKSHDQITDAAKFVVRAYGLDHHNLAGFDYREELDPKSILLTANGDVGERITVQIPRNLFDFDFNLVVNMLAHEMMHVRQKSPEEMVMDKNEREWQAYYEMLFHEIFPQVPEVSNFHKKFFANKALEYYRRMGEESDLQLKYAEQKNKVQELIARLDEKVNI